jgi:hypothetical protein
MGSWQKTSGRLKVKKSLYAFVLSLGISGLAYAGGAWNGVTVLGLTAYSTEVGAPGWVQIHLSLNGSGGASCGSSYKNYVAIDTSTAAGAFAAAMAQQAFIMGQTVNISGTGACNVNSQIETLAGFTNGN